MTKLGVEEKAVSLVHGEHVGSDAGSIARDLYDSSGLS